MFETKKMHGLAMLIVIGLVACAGAPPAANDDSEKVGELSVPLVSAGPNGTQYALAGTFSLVGPETITTTVSPMDTTFATADAVTMMPRVGSYNLTLSGWTLYALSGNPPAPMAVTGAQLTSAATVPVSILNNQTTSVVFQFSVPGGQVVFARGTLNIDFTVSQGAADGAACMVATDCQSKVCTAGVCVAPSCSDGVQNGSETSPDCGGGCMCGGAMACTGVMCPAGQMCVVDPMTGAATCVGNAQSCTTQQAAMCPAGTSCVIDPASGNAVCAAQAQWSCLKINEVSTGSAASASDEYVELYNTCATNMDLTGGSLVYRSAAGTSDVGLVTFAAGTTIGASSFLLYAGSGYTGMASGVYPGAGTSQLGGGLQLRDPMGAPVDSVAWGTATNAFIEGTVVAAPAQGASIARSPNGNDTNNNSADFLQQARTPFAANP